MWIPPACQRVRGVMFVLNNMLEERVTVDPTIRQAAADCGLAIVWVQPGSDKGSPMSISPEKGAGDAVLKVLADLAKESGYSEIEFAPLLVEEHSAASPFVWQIQDQLPDRIFAAIPLKGFHSWWHTGTIPNLQVSSEWAEHGEGWKQPWDRKWLTETTHLRKENHDALIGEFADLSSGHFDFTPQSAGPIAMFIRKAVKARIPDDAPLDRPVKLKTVDPKSGWLLDPATIGTPQGKPVPYSQWQGDPQDALWYFDEELATTINDYMADQLRKKPQMLDLVIDGKPAVLDKVGLVPFSPRWDADGQTFKVQAIYLDKSPAASLYGGGPLGHASVPIQFRVGSGALDQVGPDTFKVAIHRGVVLNQGNPWEPWIIGYSNGDDQYRRTDRPFHPNVNIVNKDGEAQSIDFPKIPDVSVGSVTVPLQGKASSGLPIEYFMVSGPAEIAKDGASLHLLPIPPRSRYPVRVLVGAYQWGRAIDPKVKSAGPIVQEFSIDRPEK
jgi:hypothetical protein